jgi:hypothetical protein
MPASIPMRIRLALRIDVGHAAGADLYGSLQAKKLGHQKFLTINEGANSPAILGLNYIRRIALAIFRYAKRRQRHADRYPNFTPCSEWLDGRDRK